MQEDDFGYSKRVCDILERVRINSVNLNNYHRQRFFHFKSYNKYFRLPIIILSIISASIAVGLQSLDVDQKSISISTCIISLIIAMLSAVEMHLSIADKLEESYKKSKAYYALAIDIYKNLKLSAAERGERGSDYLGRVMVTYGKLMEQQELMKRPLKMDFLTKIKEDYNEYKRTPSATPVQSIEDEGEEMLKHAESYIFSPRGSPDKSIQLDVEEDVESNLSK
jgi:hypothetical protein